MFVGFIIVFEAKVKRMRQSGKDIRHILQRASDPPQVRIKERLYKEKCLGISEDNWWP